MLYNFKVKNLGFYKIYLALLLIIIAILLGVIGYMHLENVSFIDALYMAIITISTVGFGEIKEFSSEGKVFTIVLIIIHIGIFTYSLTVITSYVVDGEFKKQLKKYRMDKKINKLKNHIIVCGYGRNGQNCCEELTKNNETFILIEKDNSVVASLSGLDNPILIGDATDDKTLLEANIQHARSLITTLPVDAQNVFVVLSAKSLNPKISIISRASANNSINKLKMAGVDHVVLPETIGGHYMANLVTRPDIIEFYHLMTEDVETSINIEAIDYCNLRK